MIILQCEAKHVSIHGKEFKISTPKEFLQRFLIAVPQVKAKNTSENLLNQICQIIYSLRMNKKQFLFCKEHCGGINHYQLLNEYVLHNLF